MKNKKALSGTEISGAVELRDEELKDVAGGTSYSSGVEDPYEHIIREYVIVTALNYCDFSPDYCCNCKYSFKSGITRYCSKRWLGHSTVKTVQEPNGVKTITIVDD